MLRRSLARSLVAALLLAVLMAVAPAAHAKGPSSATIEGPGITPAVRIDSYESVGVRPGMDDLMRLTGAERLLFDMTTRLAQSIPAASLGPRYTVVYGLPDERGTDTAILRQDLYPFAAGGPVTYTPPGQRSMFVAATMASGWHRADGRLTPVLAALGARAPHTLPGPATAQHSPAAPRTPAWPGTATILAWVGASVIVVAAAGLLLWRWRPWMDRAASVPARQEVTPARR